MQIQEPYIQVVPEERKRKSGIILAGTDEKDITKNDIVVVNTYKDCKICKKDDKLILGFVANSTIYELEDGEKIHFINENDIIAVY